MRKPRILAGAVVLVLHAAGTAAAQGPTRVRLASEEGHIVTQDGVKIFYRVIGSGGDTVVVVHGAPSGLKSIAPDLLPLARARTLVFYDQRANGWSTPVAHDSLNTSRQAVGDLDAVRRHFRLNRMVLVAHSAGALIAALYAQAHPDRVERMILIGAAAPSADIMRAQFRPSARIDSAYNVVRLAHSRARGSRADSVKACWDYWAIMLRGYFPDATQARRTWGDVCNMPQGTMLSGVQGAALRSLGAYDLRAELASVRAPTLIVHGDRDPVPVAAADAWAAALPNARVFLIAGAGHLPYVDHPEIFFPTVDAFLRGNWPGTTLAVQASAPPNRPPKKASSAAYDALFGQLEGASRAVAVAVTAGEWQRAASGYTSDAYLFAPGAPPVAGRYSIAAFWQAAHSRGLRTVELQTMEVESDGALAVELGKYLIRGERDEIIDVGKFMAVFRRQDGGWKLYRDMYNSSAETRSVLEIPDYLPPPVGTWAAPAK